MKRYLFTLVIVAVCSLSLFAQPVKNPTRAAVYSALLPGGGQLYNQAYVKAGIVIGVQAYLVASAIAHDKKVDDYRKLASQTNDVFLQQHYQSKQQEYKEMRTSDFWWMGITAALSVLDAYVDAHLSDFDANKKKLHLLFEDEQVLIQYRF